MPSGAAEEFVIDVTAKFNDEVTKGAAEVDKEISKLNKEAAAYGKAMDTARQKAKNLEDEQKRLTERLNAAQDKYSAVKSKADTYRNGIEALKKRLADLNSQQRGVSEGIKSVQDRLKSATSGVKGSNDEATRLTNTLKQLQQQHSNLNSSISITKERISADTSAFKLYADGAKQSYQALGDLMGQSKRIDQELENNKRALNENAAAYTKVAQEQLKLRQQNPDTSSTTKPPTSKAVSTADAIKSAKGLASAGKTMNSIGNKLTLGVTTPILAAGTASIKASMDFEDSMAKVSTIADTSQMSIGQLSSGIVKLSNSTGKSVGDLSEGLYQAISSGIQTKDTLQFMQTASKAAIGGFTDTETAVDGLTTVLNAYGMKSTEVGNIANQMMVAQNLGKTTFGEMAQEVGNAIPTFSSAQVGTKEFFSSLAVLTANGIHTQEAVTGLKSALSNIIKPSDDASKAAEALGIKFDTNELKSKGWMGFMQEVRGKLSQAAPAYMAAADKVASLNQQIEAQSQSGKKNNSVLKDLKQQLKGAKADMGALEKANGGTLSAFGTMFGSVEGLNSVLTLTSQQGVSLYNESMKQMGGSTDYVTDAFNKMHNTNGAKFKDEMNTLKNTAVGLATELMPLITEGLKKGEQFISMLGNLSKGQKSALGTGLIGAITAGPLLKTVGGAFSGIGKIKEFFAKHSTASSAVSGVAQVGTDAVKAASKTGLLTKAVSGVKTALGLVPLPLKIIGGAAVGVGIAMKAWHDYCVNDDIQKHFGNVELSMEEVEDIAKRLTTTKWTAMVDTVVENDSKITDLQNDIKTNLETIEKTKWKVSVGLKLTAEETSDFKSSVDSYIKNAKNLVEQQQYTAKLAINVVYPEGSVQNTNATEYANTYYGKLNSEMSTLGTNLSKAVNDALDDGLITNAEMGNIDKALEAIQKKNDEIEKARSDSKLHRLQSEALKDGLSEGSFEKLLDEMNSDLTKKETNAETSVTNALAPASSAVNSHKISQALYDQNVDEANRSVDKQMADNRQSNLGVGVDTIRKQYSDKFAGAEPKFNSSFNGFLKNFTSDPHGYGIQWNSLITSINSQIVDTAIKGTSGSAIKTLMGKLQPMTSDLLKSTDDWLRKNQAVPKSISDRLESTFETEVMSGDTTHAQEYTGMQMGKSSNYLKMLEDAKKSGATIPEQVIKGAEISSGKVFKDGVFKIPESAKALTSAELNGVIKKMGVDAKSDFASSFKGLLQSDTQSSISTLMSGITGKQNGAQIGDLFKNAHINIGSGLANAIAEAKPEVQTKLSGLLAGCFSGIQLDTVNLKSAFSGLNIGIKDGLESSLAGLSPNIQQGLVEAAESTNPTAALATLQQKFSDNATLKGLQIDVDSAGNIAIGKVNTVVGIMNGITSSAMLVGPGIDNSGLLNGAVSGAEMALSAAQGELNGKALTMRVNLLMSETVSGGIAGAMAGLNAVTTARATGGIVGTKSLTWLAEEGYPEMVIPFNPARRQRALGLWQQTGEALGVKPQYYAAGGIVGSQLPQRRDPQEIFAAQPAVAAAAPVAAVASSGMNLGGVQIIVQGGDGDIVKVIAAHKQEIAEAVAEVVNAAMDSDNVPMAQGA